MLSANAVGFHFERSRWLFQGVDLEMAPGESIAVVGPSGSGKSTLLALLSGHLQPSIGTVKVSAGRAAPFAWVLQSLNVLGRRSVLENAMLHNLADGIDRGVSRRRASEALDSLGLSEHKNRRSNTLSGGELQRLTVARAMASSRPIVLADEPTSQLDRANAILVMGTLFAPQPERVVIVVTHDTASLPTDTRVVELTSSGLR